MNYTGMAITVQVTDDGIAELCFDLKEDSVNKFNALTLGELKEATAAIKADESIKGVIVTSGKPVFIVGADITEFGSMFGASEEELVDKILGINTETFNAFEATHTVGPNFGFQRVHAFRCEHTSNHFAIHGVQRRISVMYVPEAEVGDLCPKEADTG